MSEKKVLIIICTPLRFYSQGDEELFFEWIKRIKSVESYKGQGRELHLYFLSGQIPLFGIFCISCLRFADSIEFFVFK